MNFPQIDPVIFSLGPLHVRWYGLMYIIGFACSYLLVKRQLRQVAFKEFDAHFDNLNTVLILCVIIGGRLGYVVLYNFSYYLSHPAEVFATWNGGMSFHGACCALIIGGVIYCKRAGLDFLRVADIYAATFPLGITFGRIGNFINGELWGRVTTVPWAIVFPDGGMQPRHPSQLYEAALEGFFLFFLLWKFRRNPWMGKSGWPHGSIFAMFLIGYGVVRSFVEMFREPDSQIGYLFGMLTMGQLLCTVMIVAGILIWLLLNRSARG